MSRHLAAHLGAHLGVGEATVTQAWRDFGIRPHGPETFAIAEALVRTDRPYIVDARRRGQLRADDSDDGTIKLPPQPS